MSWSFSIAPAADGAAPRALLSGALCIFNAAELKIRLQQLLGDELQEVREIDLAEVCEIDTAGIQLLLASRRTAAAAGHTLSFVNPSAALLDLVQLLNLEAELGFVDAAAAGVCDES